MKSDDAKKVAGMALVAILAVIGFRWLVSKLPLPDKAQSFLLS